MSPRYEDHRTHVDVLMRAVLAACDPGPLTSLAMRQRAIGAGVVASLAVGKAALSMDAAAAAFLPPGTPRLVIVPAPPACSSSTPLEPSVEPGRVPAGPADSCRILVADHPLPTERSVHAGQAVASLVDRAARAGTGVLLVLLSGGASALMTVPAEGVCLRDLRDVTEALLLAGATIEELNAVRKHLDQLKGGRLGIRAWPLAVEVLVLSDVPGDRLDVIGSGPCAPDSTTCADALAVLARYGLRGRFPSLEAHLHARAHSDPKSVGASLAETPKPGDDRLSRVRHTVIGSNATALAAAAAAAQTLGFRVVHQEGEVRGESAGVGERLARLALATRLARTSVSGQASPACILLGGETTVRVGAAKGVGGRNLELVLAAASVIAGYEDVVVSAFATDGIDGPTDAAGALATGETADRAAALGLDLRTTLTHHDSYRLFAALEAAGVPCLLRSGPTGTNVNDIAVALTY